MPTAATMQQMGERAVLHMGDEAIEVYALRHLFVGNRDLWTSPCPSSL